MAATTGTRRRRRDLIVGEAAGWPPVGYGYSAADMRRAAIIWWLSRPPVQRCHPKVSVHFQNSRFAPRSLSESRFAPRSGSGHRAAAANCNRAILPPPSQTRKLARCSVSASRSAPSLAVSSSICFSFFASTSSTPPTPLPCSFDTDKRGVAGALAPGVGVAKDELVVGVGDDHHDGVRGASAGASSSLAPLSRECECPALTARHVRQCRPESLVGTITGTLQRSISLQLTVAASRWPADTWELKRRSFGA